MIVECEGRRSHSCEIADRHIRKASVNDVA